MEDVWLRAFTALYEDQAGAVHRYAARRSNAETADEVVAQVFAVAWRRRASMPEDPVPWLYGVPRRVLADQRRGAARRRRLRERLRIQSGPSVEDDRTSLCSQDAALDQAIGQMSPLDREALLLTYWEDLAPADVAAVLGCSQAALAVRLHRARRRLRKRMEAAAETAQAPQAASCAIETESM